MASVGDIQVKVELSDALVEFLAIAAEDAEVMAGYWEEVMRQRGRQLDAEMMAPLAPVVALHPHANCPVCRGERPPGILPDHEAVEVMIRCIRQSAQDTVAALRARGIVLARS